MSKAMYINQPKRKKRGLKGFVVSFVCLGLLVFVVLNMSPLKGILDATGDEVTMSLPGADGDEPGWMDSEAGAPERDDAPPMQADPAQAEGEAVSEPPAQEASGQADGEAASTEPEADESETMGAGPEQADGETMRTEPEQPASEAGRVPPEQPESEAVDEPSDQAASAPDPEELWRETFSAVPASTPVDESYFHDALFIGDSRVMSLMLYSGITDAVFYTEKGVNVTTLLTKPIVMQTGGTKITIPEALRSKRFGKIYIKTGINELGWRNTRMFAEAYGEIVDRIREIQPTALIYVQSILPVSRTKAEKDAVINNARIAEFNELIKKMTWEKGVSYLDVYQFMIDDEGFLPEEAGSDGVHLNKEYCRLWLAYLREHTVRGSSGRGPSMVDAEERRGYRD